MKRGIKNSVGPETAGVVRYLSEESNKATGRERIHEIGRLLADMDEMRSLLSRERSPLLSWAKEELPKGRFRGIPWFFLAMGRYFEAIGKWADALEWYRIGTSESERSGYRGIHLDALVSQGHLRAKRGEGKEAGDLYGIALEKARESGDEHGMMRALGGMGALRFDEGALGEACRLFTKVLGIAERVGDLSWKAHMQNDLGAVQSVRGMRGPAIRAFEASLKIHRDQGYERGVARSLYNLASLHLEREEFIPAGSFFAKSQEVSRTLNWEELVVMNLLGRAELFVLLSEHETALTLAESALEKATVLGDPYSTLEADRLIALLLFEKGGGAESLGLLERCLEGAKRIRSRCELARIFEARGNLLAKGGRARAALADLRKARDLYRGMGLLAGARRTAEVMKGVGERGS